MNEREKLLESIANTIKDYRSGEVAPPTPEHVDRWLRQFDEGVQIPLLRELDHVFGQTYINKPTVMSFLTALLQQSKLTGDDPCDFWKGANFLNIQGGGESQREMLTLFDQLLYSRFGIHVQDCGSENGPFIYLDDVIFSGNRVAGDLSRWISEEAPDNATVHVVVIATHTNGAYYAEQCIDKAAREHRKKITTRFWRIREFENRRSDRHKAEVLWPVEVPDDETVAEYISKLQRYPFEPRRPGASVALFSLEGGRQLMEREFLIAGARILSFCSEPKEYMRPLGYSRLEGLGFGSMIVTFRNCPNNAPLALWWGDPEAVGEALQWYPLFPRKTYDQTFGGYGF